MPFGIKSTECNVKIQAQISSQQSVVVYSWWVNYQGAPVLYADVQPGKSYVQKTYGSHPWIVADEQGNTLQLFIGETANMDITIK